MDEQLTAGIRTTLHQRCRALSAQARSGTDIAGVLPRGTTR
jgi:hypothetical protein